MQTRRQFLKAVGVIGTGLALSRTVVGGGLVRADDTTSKTPPYIKKGKITRADREAAAARLKAVRSRAGLSTPNLSLVPGPNGYLVPDYFGTTPNWALSPLPTVVGGVVTGGGMRKFVDTLPGLYISGVTPIASVRNNLLQYIPVAQPNTTAYPAGGAGYTSVPTVTITDVTGVNAVATATVAAGLVTAVTVNNGGTGYSQNPHIALTGGGATSQAMVMATVVAGVITAITTVGSDYYEIALVEYRERLHTDLPVVTGVWPTQTGGTKLRGYMQTNATDPLIQNVPSYLGPTVVAQRDRPVRIKFTNMLPTTALGGNLFIPTDTTYMGAGMGPQGSVKAITLTNGGQGYTAAPTVTIAPPTGPAPRVTATAVATMRPGGATNLSYITVTNGGSGYLTAPVVTISAPTGPLPRQTATATAVLVGLPGAKYTENRATLHLHGGNTPWISDGTPHQWTTPAGENAAYPQGVAVYNVPDMPAQTVGSLTFFYTNQQSARLMFYHDHAYGITRLNVYAGEASGYLLTDKVEQDFINGTNNSGANPTALTVLPGLGTPLVIQDKTFVDATKIGLQDPTWNWGTNPGTPGTPGAAVTGDLWFPHVYMPNQNPYNIEGANPMGRFDYGPWFWPIFNPQFGTIPNPYAALPGEPPVIPGTPNPSGTPEAFMDTPLVNGTVYPSVSVPAAPMRLRILNACNDRFLNLQLHQATGIMSVLTLVSGGSGYPDNPVVTIAPPAVGGAPATASAEVDLTVGSLTYGHVTSLTILNVGSGYTAAPLVTIAPPPAGGTLATATATFYTVSPAAGVGMTEVGMVESCPGSWPTGWPSPDARAGGVPDPALRGPAMVQIGTEGGFLPAPAVIVNRPIGFEYGRRSITVLNALEKALFLAPAERADVIVDFTPFAGRTLIMYNDAPAPVPAFDSRIDYFTADGDQTAEGGAPSTMAGYGPNTRTIMQIKVAGTASLTPAPVDYVNPTILTNLNTAIPAAFRVSQDRIIVPQAPYNAAYNPAIPFLGDASVYAKIQSNSMAFTPIGSVAAVTLPLLSKAIQELFTLDYGRMNATLGVELPFTTAVIQTTIPLGYIDPTTEIIQNPPSVATKIGTTGDGTQMWKLTHNGVDSHGVHFHLFNVQIINRIGWDGAIKPPSPNELGWKDTVVMNPLEDIVVALRAFTQVLPWKIGNSLRPFDVTSPIGSTAGFTNVDTSNNTPITVRNLVVNYGAEYVWHCHLLGHEENDMMRPMIFAIAPEAPTSLVATNVTAPRRVRLDWTNNSLNATRFMIQRANNAGFTSNLRTFYTADGETNYRDSTVSATTTYYYRVYAQNIVGGVAPGNPSVTMTSLVSNTVSILSLLAPEAQPLNPNDPAPLPSVGE